MTGSLRELLQAEADQAPTYDVYRRAIRTARRRAGLRLAAGIVALLGFAAAVVPAALAPPPMPPASPQPSIPSTVYPAPSGCPTVTDSPEGPVAIVFGGKPDDAGRVSFVAVGAKRDVYRTFTVDPSQRDIDRTLAGARVLLSPDGGQLAYPDYWHYELSVVDLRTGRVRVIPYRPAVANAALVPLAWSPDGSRIAVATEKENPARTFRLYDLGLVEVESGNFELIQEGWVQTTEGVGFAFAPDGKRYAYYDLPSVVVGTIGSSERARFGNPSGDYLAGRGAWTPDGAAVAMVTGSGFQYRDPVTWQALDTPRWILPDGDVRRVLGWDLLGSPVVAAVHTDGSALGLNAPPIADMEVFSLQVNEAPKRFVTGEPGLLWSLDISADVIAAGLTRPGAPQQASPSRLGWLFLAGAVLLVIWWVVRWRLRRLTLLE